LHSQARQHLLAKEGDSAVLLKKNGLQVLEIIQLILSFQPLQARGANYNESHSFAGIYMVQR